MYILNYNVAVKSECNRMDFGIAVNNPCWTRHGMDGIPAPGAFCLAASHFHSKGRLIISVHVKYIKNEVSLHTLSFY